MHSRGGLEQYKQWAGLSKSAASKAASANPNDELEHVHKRFMMAKLQNAILQREHRVAAAQKQSRVVPQQINPFPDKDKDKRHDIIQLGSGPVSKAFTGQPPSKEEIAPTQSKDRAKSPQTVLSTIPVNSETTKKPPKYKMVKEVTRAPPPDDFIREILKLREDVAVAVDADSKVLVSLGITSEIEAKKSKLDIQRKQKKKKKMEVSELVKSAVKAIDKLPMWKHRLNGEWNPPANAVLKGSKLFKAIVRTVVVLIITPLKKLKRRKLETRDRERLDLEKTLTLYSETCDSWIAKFIKIPFVSVEQVNYSRYFFSMILCKIISFINFLSL